MDSALAELFRHNLWANLRLLDTCAALSDELLQATAPATYGSVRDTLVHLLGAEERYVAMLSGQPRPTPLERVPFPGFPALREHALHTGRALIEIASTFDASGVLQVPYDDGIHRLPAVVPVIQAINHATEHRLHIVAILHQNGVETPPIDGWAYNNEGINH